MAYNKCDINLDYLLGLYVLFVHLVKMLVTNIKNEAQLQFYSNANCACIARICMY